MTILYADAGIEPWLQLREANVLSLSYRSVY